MRRAPVQQTGRNSSGLQQALGMSNHQFSIALTITFAAEIPTSLVLKRVGGNVMIPLLVTIWGIVTTFQGFLKSYKALLATRFLLGAVEGSLAIVLYLSNFYKREELQIRIAIFSSSASLSGALSGLLAYWLVKMDGLGGIPGWGWIFIIEGIFTTLFGLFGFLVFPLSPSTCPLSKILAMRIEKDQPSSAAEQEEKFSWGQVGKAYKSPHVLLTSLALFMTGTNLYSLAYFQPTSHSYTQLVSVPPFAVGFVAMIVTSYLSDRFRARGLNAILCSIVGLLGYVLFYLNPTQNSRYISLFLSTAGIYSVSPTLYAWLANNSTPHYRRAAAIALGPVSANSGGILSTWLFPSEEEPDYHTGITVNLIFSGAIIIICTINLAWLRRQIEGEQSFETSMFAWEVLGDQHPEFIYAY
ncbi:major facilitator superfamily domain-containing protein [Melampsora americana]|nr:major facilitator superfamily domain-containing protein [Melampsora americana]